MFPYGSVHVLIEFDGTAYFFSAANDNKDLMLYRLTDDYLDIAVAGGQGRYALYVRGERVKTVSEAEALETIAALVEGWGCG